LVAIGQYLEALYLGNKVPTPICLHLHYRDVPETLYFAICTHALRTM